MLLDGVRRRTGTCVEPVADRKGHDRRYSRRHHARSGTELGYAPRGRRSTTASPTTVAWYRDNRAWWEPLKARACAVTALAGHRRRRDARPGPPRRSLDGRAVTALTRADLDITDPDAVARRRSHGHDVVVNAAAWTDVDGAETARGRGHRGQRHAASAPRPGLPPPHGARLAPRLHRLRLRRRRGTSPYAEDAPTAPRQRLRPHQAAPASRRVLPDRCRTPGTWCAPPGCTARTAATSSRRCSAWPATRDTLDVVDDQRGQPTWSRDLADRLVALGGAWRTRPAGVYHGTASGQTTWYGLPGRCSPLPGWTPRGSARPPATASSARPPGRRTACSATTAGRRPGWRRCGTGRTC